MHLLGKQLSLLGKPLRQAFSSGWEYFACLKSSYFEQKPQSSLCSSVDNKRNIPCHPCPQLMLTVAYVICMSPLTSQKLRRRGFNRLGSSLRKCWRYPAIALVAFAVCI